jgi:hypothetical protein
MMRSDPVMAIRIAWISPRSARDLLGELGNPTLLVAMVNVVALLAIFCIHASGVPILDIGRRRRR